MVLLRCATQSSELHSQVVEPNDHQQGCGHLVQRLTLPTLTFADGNVFAPHALLFMVPYTPSGTFKTLNR
jgi:hypothetical protein